MDQGFTIAGAKLTVSSGKKLPYACEIMSYGKQGENKQSLAAYETDVLICDELENLWIPRVVIECKLGGVSTHDALTYSTKAATHKHVHPYLRYGFLAGNSEQHSIPTRLVRHGLNFDFMVAWKGQEPTAAERRDFRKLMREEVVASRKMQELLTTHRLASRTKYRILHRPLKLK